MNYIELLNAFWRYNRLKPFTSHEISMYTALLAECNEQFWPASFRLPPGFFRNIISRHSSTIIDVRRRLIEKGFISYQNIDGIGYYTIVDRNNPTNVNEYPTTDNPTDKPVDNRADNPTDNRAGNPAGNRVGNPAGNPAGNQNANHTSYIENKNKDKNKNLSLSSDAEISKEREKGNKKIDDAQGKDYPRLRRGLIGHQHRSAVLHRLKVFTPRLRRGLIGHKHRSAVH